MYGALTAASILAISRTQQDVKHPTRLKWDVSCITDMRPLAKHFGIKASLSLLQLSFTICDRMISLAEFMRTDCNR